MIRRVRTFAAALTFVLGACTASGPTPDDGGPPADGSAGLEWEELAPLPTPRTEVAAAVVAGARILVAGGFDGSGATVATVEVYDVDADRWSAGPDLPQPVDHAMAAAAGDTVYVVGGYDPDRRPTAGAYALVEGAWTELPSLPEGRAAGGAAVVDDVLLVVGGVGPGGLADETFALDLDDARSWASTAGLPTPREHLGVTALEGVAYAVGGRVGGLEGNLATVERLDPATGRWQPVEELPTARGGTAAAAARGLVICAGGEEPSGTFDEVEAFDPESGSWRTLPPLPTARHGLGVVAANEVLYVIGGGPEPGLSVSGRVDALDLRTL